MKNIIQAVLITCVTLSLFACDSSSSTTKKKDTGGVAQTFDLDVSVSGLSGTLQVANNNGTPLTIDVNGTKTLSTGLADKATYNVIVSNAGHPDLQTCKVISGNSTIQNGTATVNIKCAFGGDGNGVQNDGRNYYNANCQDCHQAGNEDKTKAFGISMDLAKNYQSRVKARNISGSPLSVEGLALDMHLIGTQLTGYNLMGDFSAVPAQTVDDLRAYFDFVCVPNTARNSTCP